VTSAEFARLIHNGHGRAIVYARSHDVSAFCDVILDAVLHCRTFDPIFDGTQAGYIWELLETLPGRQFYLDEIVHAMPSSGDGYDAELLYLLTYYMAADGDKRARRILYESFPPGPGRADSIGNVFVWIDGMKGFLFAAGKLGELHRDHPKAIQGSMDFCARESLGDEAVDVALAEAGRTNPHIETYREQMERNRNRPSKREPKPPIEEVAQALLETTDAATQAALLRTFCFRAFPGNPMLILGLTSSSDATVSRRAFGALEFLTHPAIRELAFSLIANGAPDRGRAILLLENNHESGDHRIALDWYAAESDPESSHDLGRGLRNLWEKHADPATYEEMLRARYEKEPCGFCRSGVVKELIAINSLPPEWREECAVDAYDETRELVSGC
jgi:hypothetical protein